MRVWGKVGAASMHACKHARRCRLAFSALTSSPARCPWRARRRQRASSTPSPSGSCCSPCRPSAPRGGAPGACAQRPYHASCCAGQDGEGQAGAELSTSSPSPDQASMQPPAPRARRLLTPWLLVPGKHGGACARGKRAVAAAERVPCIAARQREYRTAFCRWAGLPGAHRAFPCFDDATLCMQKSCPHVSSDVSCRMDADDLLGVRRSIPGGQTVLNEKH